MVVVMTMDIVDLRGAHHIEVVIILQDILLMVEDQGESVLIHLILVVLGEAFHLGGTSKRGKDGELVKSYWCSMLM